jgi:hypothetical protein
MPGAGAFLRPLRRIIDPGDYPRHLNMTEPYPCALGCAVSSRLRSPNYLSAPRGNPTLERVEAAVAEAMDTITAADAAGWFRHRGYG